MRTIQSGPKPRLPCLIRHLGGGGAEAGPDAQRLAEAFEAIGVDVGAGEQAVADVVVEEEERHLLQAGADGHQLGEHILAAAPLAQHALEAAYLALDAAQARLGRLQFGRVHRRLP